MTGTMNSRLPREGYAKIYGGASSIADAAICSTSSGRGYGRARLHLAWPTMVTSGARVAREATRLAREPRRELRRNLLHAPFLIDLSLSWA